MRPARGRWAAITRRIARCVCALQGRRLCGVCALHRRMPRAGVLLFPEISYRDGLALLKRGAMELKRERLEASARARVDSHPWMGGSPEPLSGERIVSAVAERTLSCGPKAQLPCSRREAGGLSQRGHIRRRSAWPTLWPPRRQSITRTAPRARSQFRRCASRKHWAASNRARVQQLLLGSHRLASIGSAWCLCQSLWPSRCWHLAHICLPFVFGASAFHT